MGLREACGARMGKAPLAHNSGSTSSSAFPGATVWGVFLIEMRPSLQATIYRGSIYRWGKVGVWGSMRPSWGKHLSPSLPCC